MNEYITRIYQYRLYPNSTQQIKLSRLLELGRSVYNACLTKLVKFHQLHVHVDAGSANDLLESRPRYQSKADMLPQSVYSAIRKNAERVKHFYYSRTRIGRPRHRSRTRFNTIPFSVEGFSVAAKKLSLEWIGDVRIKLHRPIPDDAVLLGCTLKVDKLGRWFALVRFRRPLIGLERSDSTCVGIDMGVSVFATLSDGNAIISRRFSDEMEAEIKHLKKLRRRYFGYGKDWLDRRIAKIEIHFNNLRKNFLHQQSAKLVKQYKTIYIEDLDVTQLLTKNTCGVTLRKHILDGRWDTFAKMLDYKAVGAGSQVIKVNPNGTSQICSNCGRWVQKTLTQRMHECPHCGLILGRDLNAAINIERFGAKQCSDLVAAHAT